MRKTPKSFKKIFNARINIIMGITYLFGLALCGRLFILTIIRHETYFSYAENQEKMAMLEVMKRGEIYLKDRQGEIYPIATNKGWPMVYAEPNRIIEDKRSLAAKLGKILGMDEDKILIKLSHKNDPFELIKRKLNKEEVEAIKALNAKGIKIKIEESLRYYPAGKLASHVIGFLGYRGDKRVGQYGIEEYYDKELSGRDIKDESLIKTQEEAGSNLILSLDPNIQTFVEEGLEKLIETYKATSGTVIVMNPKSGKILALANYPNFDPNYYAQVKDFNLFINPAISLVFEPGSVFKPITMAIALDQKLVTPASTYYDKGFVKIGGYTIDNADKKSFGQQSMTQVLEKSLNTGIVHVVSLIKQDVFKNYLDKFGFGKKTGIDLPGESLGNLNNLNAGRSINFATAAFGQGISVTPLQLIRAFSAIANKGVLLRPTVVESVEKSGKIQEKPNPMAVSSPQRVISPDTASRLTAMLVSVTEHGTGSKAKISGYWIATKTGTAQIPLGKARGYGDETIHTIVGFGPAYDAQFVILIKLDRPHGVRFAALSVAPLFRDIAEYLINYFEIPPLR